MVNSLFPATDRKASVRVAPAVIKDLTFWEAKFQSMNFPGMDLVEATLYPLTVLEKHNRKKQFRRIKKDFLRYLVYNYINDLRAAGLDEDAIFFLKKGIEPENFVVHVKVPFDYTGQADFSNMVLMQHYPFHLDVHRYMDAQMEGMEPDERPMKLYIPVPVGKIYIPLTMYTGSGGKGKHDRSVYAGYSEQAFVNLAQKSMPGR